MFILQLPKDNMHVRRVIVLLVYFLMHLLYVTAKESYMSDKRDGAYFRPQMRYGRSGRTSKVGEETLENKVLVSPRGDKFYYGPRYGKRSSKPGTPMSPVPKICASDEDFSCSYTGISNLYRCTLSFRRSEANNEDFLSSK